VKKGEKSIKILAPIIVKKKDEKVDEDQYFCAGFKLTHVFDISQTEGKDVPTIAKRISGNVTGYEGLKTSLELISGEKVVYVPMSYDGHINDDGISINSELSEIQTIATLIHEIAHKHLHRNLSEPIPKKQKEIEADSVAYVVCQHLGINTEHHNFEYVAVWSGDKDVKILSAQLDTIRKCASMIIEQLEKL
jgi:hypothetical protein